MLYIRSPHDAYELMKEFLGDVDREHYVVLSLYMKNQPTCTQTVHIGSLNSSITHPIEALKPAIHTSKRDPLWFHFSFNKTCRQYVIKTIKICVYTAF